jgi:hypothetical protein
MRPCKGINCTLPSKLRLCKIIVRIADAIHWPELVEIDTEL